MPKQNPVVDYETGDRLRARVQVNKDGKKNRWKSKNKMRKDKFWNDISAM